MDNNIRIKIDNLEEKVNEIDDKLNKILNLLNSDIKESYTNMNRHIKFIEKLFINNPLLSFFKTINYN